MIEQIIDRPRRLRIAAGEAAERGFVAHDLIGKAQQAGEHGAFKMVAQTATRSAAKRGRMGRAGHRGPGDAALPGAGLAPARWPFARRAGREGEGGKSFEQLAPVKRLDVGVLDRVDLRQQPFLQTRLVLGRQQGLGIAFKGPQCVDQAGWRGQQGVERGAALLADQIVRVEPGRQPDDRQRLARPQQRQRAADGALGGALAGIVAIETQHRRIDHPP